MKILSTGMSAAAEAVGPGECAKVDRMPFPVASHVCCHVSSFGPEVLGFECDWPMSTEKPAVDPCTGVEARGEGGRYTGPVDVTVSRR